MKSTVLFFDPVGIAGSLIAPVVCGAQGRGVSDLSDNLGAPVFALMGYAAASHVI